MKDEVRREKDEYSRVAYQLESRTIQGYDSFNLYYRDAMIRRRHLADEIVALQKNDEKLRKEAAICDERFRKLKEERGIPERGE